VSRPGPAGRRRGRAGGGPGPGLPVPITDDHLLDALSRSLNRPARPLPPTLLWRARWELAAAATTAAAGYPLVHTIGPLWTLGVLGLAAGGVAGRPAARRRLARRISCVLLQHRLRTGLANARVFSPAGRLPALLWTRPTRDGVEILLWCPAGVIAEQLDRAADVLAAACYASQLTVRRHYRYTHLAWVHIVGYPRPPVVLPGSTTDPHRT
jgi:hypothetical protein